MSDFAGRLAAVRAELEGWAATLAGDEAAGAALAKRAIQKAGKARARDRARFGAGDRFKLWLRSVQLNIWQADCRKLRAAAAQGALGFALPAAACEPAYRDEAPEQEPAPDWKPDPRFAAEVVANLPKLRARAINLTRNRSEAEDLVQETVLRALSNERKYQPGTKLAHWLQTVMRNQFLNWRRAKNPLNAAEEYEEGGANGTRPERCVAPSQEDHVFIGEAMRAMQALPAPRRAVLRALTVDRASYREASDRSGESIGTVKSHIHHARRELSAIMGVA